MGSATPGRVTSGSGSPVISRQNLTTWARTTPSPHRSFQSQCLLVLSLLASSSHPPPRYAEVLFRDETGEYSESSSQPLYSPANCFVSPDESRRAPHSLKVHHAILLSTPIERNPEARRRSIDAHGTRCCICELVSGPRTSPWRKDISTFIMFARFPRSEASMWSIRLGTHDRSVQTATQCCTWTGSAVLSRMSACSWSGEGVNSSVYRCRRPRKSKGRTVPVLSHD